VEHLFTLPRGIPLLATKREEFIFQKEMVSDEYYSPEIKYCIIIIIEYWDRLVDIMNVEVF
jgi:hypothetical protein